MYQKACINECHCLSIQLRPAEERIWRVYAGVLASFLPDELIIPKEALILSPSISQSALSEHCNIMRQEL